MERIVNLYLGNASKFKESRFYILPEYTVTEDGKVFSSGGEQLKEEIKNGYKYVQLNINGKCRWCKVHRIVACTFTDICGDFNEVVNHLDENKFNNSAFNLKWATNYENTHYGTIKERTKQTIETNKNLKQIVKQFYKENSIKYTKNVKIIKLDDCYKFRDSLNKITLYTQGKEFILDKNRGDFEKITKCKKNKVKKITEETPGKKHKNKKRERAILNPFSLYILYPKSSYTRKN